MKKSELRQLIRKEIISEQLNPSKYDLWRSANNKKSIGRYIIYIEDVMGNKKRYVANIMYRITSDMKDSIYMSERLIGGHSGNGTSFSVSNLGNRPEEYYGGPDETTYWREHSYFEKDVLQYVGTPKFKKILHQLITDWMGDDQLVKLQRWMATGRSEIIKAEFVV